MVQYKHYGAIDRPLLSNSKVYTYQLGKDKNNVWPITFDKLYIQYDQLIVKHLGQVTYALGEHHNENAQQDLYDHRYADQVFYLSTRR